MKATIVVTHDGKISVVTREGAFEEGRAKLKEFLKSLGAEGVELDREISDSDFEQHRHDHERARVRREVRSS